MKLRRIAKHFNDLGGANLGAGHKFGGANVPPCPPLAPPLSISNGGEGGNVKS